MPAATLSSVTLSRPPAGQSWTFYLQGVPRPGMPLLLLWLPPGPLSCARFPSLGTQSSSSLLFSHSCCLLTSPGSTLKGKPPGTWHTLNCPDSTPHSAAQPAHTLAGSQLWGTRSVFWLLPFRFPSLPVTWATSALVSSDVLFVLGLGNFRLMFGLFPPDVMVQE